MPRVEAARVVSFRAPTQVGMKMVEGPWFFAGFAGGWTFTPASEGGTAVTWRYTFTVRPAWLSPVADRIGLLVLGRDIRRRLAGYAKGCEDPTVVASAEGLVELWSP